jgi:hypothetical protein
MSSLMENQSNKCNPFSLLHLLPPPLFLVSNKVAMELWLSLVHGIKPPATTLSAEGFIISA